MSRSSQEDAAALDPPTAEALLEGVLRLGREVHLEMNEPELVRLFLETLVTLFPRRQFAIRAIDPRSPDKSRAYSSSGNLRRRIEDEPLAFRRSSVEKSGIKSALLESAKVRLSERWYSPFTGSVRGFVVPLVASGELYGALDVGYSSAFDLRELDEKSLLPIVNHLSVALRNERLHREASVLRDYQAKLIEHANALILGVDRYWRVTVCNQALCRLTGFERSEVVGHDIRDWLLGNESTRLTEMFSNVLEDGMRSGGVDSVEVTLQTRNGPVHTVWGVAAISGRRRIEAVVAIGQDQTQVRELQKQVVQAEKLATLGQLAAGVAHELNNPLTSIMVYSNYLLEKTQHCVESGRSIELQPADVEKMRRVHASAQRISTFAQELVQYAKPARAEPVQVDLNAVVMQSLTFCEHLFERDEISLIDSLESDLPAVLAIPGQLEQVLINLITNASQAIDEAGAVTVRTFRSGEETVGFSVADNGPGIAEDRYATVFEPFFTTKSDGRGTGLGLSIVRNIVEQHRGQIELSRADEGGALFQVMLPTGHSTTLGTPS